MVSMTSTEIIRLIKDGKKGVGVGNGDYISLHCHHHNDSGMTITRTKVQAAVYRIMASFFHCRRTEIGARGVIRHNRSL